MKQLTVLTAPPFVMIYYAIVVVLVRNVLSFEQLPFHTWIGAALIIASLGFNMWSIGVFKQAETTVDPFKVKDTSALVTSGPFGISRNPMYLGMVGILVGVTFITATFVGFALAALFVLYIDRSQIVREEKAIAEIFGDEFTAYRARVRKWL